MARREGEIPRDLAPRGGEIPRDLAPGGGEIPRDLAPGGARSRGGRNPWDTGLKLTQVVFTRHFSKLTWVEPGSVCTV